MVGSHDPRAERAKNIYNYKQQQNMKQKMDGGESLLSVSPAPLRLREIFLWENCPNTITLFRSVSFYRV